MDHHRRRANCAQLGRAVAAGDDRRKLARHGSAVAAPLPVDGGDLADVVDVDLEPRRLDQLRHRDRMLDIRLKLVGPPSQQHRVGGEPRLAAPAAAGVRHHRRQRQHAIGMPCGERLGDHPAHRDAGDMGALDAEMVEQADRVERHIGERVAGADAAREQLPGRRRRQRVQVRRPARVAVVEADDAEAPIDQLPAEVLAPADHLHTQPHHEQQGRIAVAAEALVAELDIPDGAVALVHLDHVLVRRSRSVRPGYPATPSPGRLASSAPMPILGRRS